MKKTVNRGRYNEIPLYTLTPTTAKKVQNLVKLASKAEKVDEHNSWAFGSEFDAKGRGEALNWDLYGYGQDYHNHKFLAVIQIRQWSKTTKNGWAKIRKNYFLLGRNEDESVFAHAIESRVIHSAAKAGKDVVQACQSWIFGKDYKKVIRHGDVALVPVRANGGENLAEKRCTLENSHLLEADEMKLNTKNGQTLYAKNPTLKHLPGIHPPVTGQGWYKIIVGKRSSFWTFAAPTVD